MYHYCLLLQCNTRKSYGTTEKNISHNTDNFGINSFSQSEMSPLSVYLITNRSAVCFKLNEKKPADLPDQRGDWLHPTLCLDLNASPFRTPWSEAEETIRETEEIMKCLRCCHSHPAPSL